MPDDTDENVDRRRTRSAPSSSAADVSQTTPSSISNRPVSSRAIQHGGEIPGAGVESQLATYACILSVNLQDDL